MKVGAVINVNTTNIEEQIVGKTSVVTDMSPSLELCNVILTTCTSQSFFLKILPPKGSRFLA